MTAPAATTAPAGFPFPAGVTAEVLEAAALLDAGPIDPELVPCATCAQPPLVHDDVDHPHRPAPAYALALAAAAAEDRQVMADVVEHLDAAHVSSGRKGPSPSDAGKCRRQLWYRDRPPADYVPRVIDSRRAALGTITHDAATAARSARYPWRQYKLRVAIPGLDRDGELDEYDPVLGRVIDWKTAGEAKWAIVGDDGPTGDQWDQGDIYAYALDFAGYPVRDVAIITINRDTGDEETFVRPYDPARSLAALDRLTEAATMVEAGVLPPRDGYGPRDWRCKWCPALDHCWQTARAAELGRSPVSLTLLGETPDDPSIAWAGREVLKVSAARLELEKLEDRAKDLVQGIAPRLYDEGAPDGGVEVYDKWSTSYDYKGAYETLRDYYELPDGVRPALEEVGEVKRNRSKKTAVKKPRAATRAAARQPQKKKTTAADQAATKVAAQLAEGEAR
ncbi:hypothetical protein [Micromonospora sp. RP3T]|uniref:hypothetical protein n=1 Tax=Micromonospora sp. RP3T TaxID=2135446 RepID=UPI003D70DD7B